MSFQLGHANRFTQIVFLLVVVSASLVMIAGCQLPKNGSPRFAANCADGCAAADCRDAFTKIEYADVCDKSVEDTSQIETSAPVTIRNFHDQSPRPMTLEEAVEMALANNQVLQKLGGRVLSSPQGTATVFDPALLETDPNRSAEAALAAFDARFQGSANFNHSERAFNNSFIGAGANSLISNNGTYRSALTKTSGGGTQFTVRNLTDYSASNSPANSFRSTWDTVMQAEIRQPLGRGYGTAINRIAGPNAVAGQYNGVLLARIRGDVALTDFEASVRDLVRDVEQNYWELYFAYRDLDVKIRARESARLIWQNRKKRVDAGLSRPDDEAQTRQQYYNFEQQVSDALSGNAQGTNGVLGSERQLRRLLGLNNSDGQLIRPITEPTIAPVLFDWDQSQQTALTNRVEIRRQKWIVRQRELESFAARKLNKWQFDFVGSYGARGFGDNLFGSRSRVNGSAFDSLSTGDLDDWGLGFELAGPVGNRQGHLAIRNTELALVREKALLQEQQKQLLMDLNAAYTEVDRAFAAIKNSYNTRVAVMAELEPKRKRAEAGDEDVFFVLDAQQRASSSESAFHRSVVNYNLALQNYVYTAGNMLENYNIQLIEGSWSSSAQQDAACKTSRYETGSYDPSKMSVCPITQGSVDQSTDLMMISEQPANADVYSSVAPGYEAGDASEEDGGEDLDLLDEDLDELDEN